MVSKTLLFCVFYFCFISCFIDITEKFNNVYQNTNFFMDKLIRVNEIAKDSKYFLMFYCFSLMLVSYFNFRIDRRMKMFLMIFYRIFVIVYSFNVLSLISYNLSHNFIYDNVINKKLIEMFLHFPGFEIMIYKLTNRPILKSKKISIIMFSLMILHNLINQRYYFITRVLLTNQIIRNSYILLSSFIDVHDFNCNLFTVILCFVNFSLIN